MLSPSSQTLKCVVIDDDPEIELIIRDILRGSDKAEVVYSFYKCSDFLNQMESLDFDLVFLDCMFPNDTKNGVDVALRLKPYGKNFIFISAVQKAFVEACRMVGALDAMPKPLTAQRVLDSVNYAHKITFPSNSKSKTHALFQIKELNAKVSIYVPDILYIRVSPEDPRNKWVKLRNDTNYTFMDCKFSAFEHLSEDFVQVNKFEMVSCNVIESMEGNEIKLKRDENKTIPMYVTISRVYKSNLKKGFAEVV